MSAGSFALSWSMQARRAVSRSTVSDDNIDAISFGDDVELAQTFAPVGDALAGGDVVLDAVPGTHEVDLGFREAQPERSLVGREYVDDAAHHDALACRSALMDTEIVVGVDRAVAVQHADFAFALTDGSMVDVGKIGDLANVKFAHAPTVRRGNPAINVPTYRIPM